MARFWVGGSGTWNASSTTHWATSSGGTGGASVPTSTDDVTFDGNSNATAYTVTLDGSGGDTNCQNLTISAPGTSGNVTLAGNLGHANVYGSIAFYSGLVGNYNGTFILLATSSKTLTFAGTTFSNGPTFNFSGIGGTWQLQDAMNIGTGSLSSNAGTLDTNGKTVTCGTFNSSGSSTRTITLGASAINCTTWTATTVTGLTFTCGTSVITFSGNTGSSFSGGGLTYYGVVATGQPGFQGANTFTNLTLTGPAAYSNLQFSANQTVTGTFTATGANASTQRMYINTDTTGTSRTITAAAVSLANVDFEDITGAGAATWSGTLLGDCGGNSGITFTTPANVFWVHDGTASHPITDALWFTTSGGATPSRFPLPQDSAVFDANSFSTTGKTVTIGITGLRLPNLAWSGFAGDVTHSPTFSANNNFSIYGTFTLVSGMTFTAGTSNISLRGRGSKTLTTAGKSLYDLTIDAFGGTVTVQDPLTATDYMYIFSGTFTVGANNIAVPGFSSNNQGRARTINMGSGVWSLSSSATPIDCSSPTNLTLNAQTCTVNVSYSGSSTRTIYYPGLTLNNVNVSNGSGTFLFNGSGTVNSLNFTGFSGAWGNTSSAAQTINGSLYLAAGMTVTFSFNLTFAATSSVSITNNSVSMACPLIFNGVGGTWTIQDNLLTTSTVTLTNGTFDAHDHNVTCTTFSSSNSNTRVISMGSGTWTLIGTGSVWNTSTATNLTLNSGTSTVIVNNASSSQKELDLGGKTLYSVTFSGSGSGALDIFGAGGVFSGTFTVSNTGGSTVTLTKNSDTTFNNIVFSGATVTWAGTNGCSITGNLTLSSGVTVSSTDALTFTSAFASTITSSGKTLAGALTFNGTGSWTLQDNLTASSSITLTKGTLALSTFTAQCTSFSSSNSNTRAITGTGTLILSGTGTIWTTTSPSSISISSGTTVKITNTSSATKTITAGGVTFGNIWCNGGASGKTAFTTNAYIAGNLKADTSVVTEYAAGISVSVGTMTMSGSTMQCATTSTYNWTIMSGVTNQTSMTISGCYCLSPYTFYAGPSPSVDGGRNTNVIFAAYSSQTLTKQNRRARPL